MIARLCGLAVDARAATRTTDPLELAAASRWIAGNALAISRRALIVPRAVPTPHLFAARVGSLGELLAAIASVPSLVDPTELPARWRMALRAIGLPLFDRPLQLALAAGASILSLAPHGRYLHVEQQPHAYVVRVAND